MLLKKSAATLVRYCVVAVVIGVAVALLMSLLPQGAARGGFVVAMQCGERAIELIGAPHTQSVEDAEDRRILAAIGDATAVAVEIAVDSVDPEFAKASYSQATHRLSSLSPDAVNQVKAALTSRGMPGDAQAQFLAMSGLAALHWLEADPRARPPGDLSPGYDQVAIERARTAHLRLIEIEPFSAFRLHEDGLSKEQLESLLIRLAQLNLDERTDRLWRAFYEGLRVSTAKNDIDLYWANYLSGLEGGLEIPKAYGEVYLEARNVYFHERLRSEIANLSTQERLVIVVGAAHLGGPGGLVARFVRDGCTAHVRP